MAEDAGRAPAIQVENLRFSLIPGGADLIRDASFAIPLGARCVVVGANGAGKSTLLELIAGSKMAPAGRVKVCGEDPFRGSSGKNVALVQSSFRAAGDPMGEPGRSLMRVWEILGLDDPALASAADPAPPSATGNSSHVRIQKLHDMLGLKRLLTRYCGSLSDGERRKVELGRKLREPREVLLLDEAATDLDLLTRRGLLEFLVLDGATVMNVTHVFDGLDAWATHVLHLHEGRVVRFEGFALDGHKPWAVDGGFFASMVTWLSQVTSAYESVPPPVASLGNGQAVEPAIDVQDLSFAYGPSCPIALRLDRLVLLSGCRCVLLGLNGSGKSSLLAVLAGRRLVEQGQVRVLGCRAFHDHTLLDPQVAILSSEWKRQVAEISAGRTLSFKELADAAIRDLISAGLEMPLLASRMLRLIQMLGIDPTKPLGALSDGMMRRVQIALKLLRPARVLLVDEVTADLDVLGRHALLTFLREEANTGCAVVYCTHILDGLDGWASHLLRMRPGGLPGELVILEDRTVDSEMHVPSEASEAGKQHAPLFERVLCMLEEDAKVEPSPLPSVKVSGSNHAELPSGWNNRGTTHAGAFGSYAWNAEKGSTETWSFGSVAPEPSNQLQSGRGVSAFGGSVQQTIPLGAVGPGMLGKPGCVPSVPTVARAADPCPFGFGARGNTTPLQELVCRGVLPPQ